MRIAIINSKAKGERRGEREAGQDEGNEESRIEESMYIEGAKREEEAVAFG